MTEDTGFSYGQDVPAGPAVPVAEPEPASPPEPKPIPVDAGPDAPFVPDGQPGWLVDALTSLHQRLRALGG